MNSFTEVMLVLVIITGADKPNVIHQELMPDMKTCLGEAARLSEHKFPDFMGAEGLKIMCGGRLRLTKEHDP